MVQGNAVVLAGPTRRLRLLRRVANLAPWVLLGFVGAVGVVTYLFPAFIRSPIIAAAVLCVGVALITASSISTMSFYHRVAVCPRCREPFIDTRLTRRPFWIPRRCHHCGYDVTEHHEGDF